MPLHRPKHAGQSNRPHRPTLKRTEVRAPGGSDGMRPIQPAADDFLSLLTHGKNRLPRETPTTSLRLGKSGRIKSG